ncbi:MAG: glycosyltransferase [Pseudomonadales bacterium]
MSTVLMLCHDQHLDRRVVAQAVSLIQRGHKVKLLALSFDTETTHEITPEGIELTRIGLSFVVPENPTYTEYMTRQQRLNGLLNSASNRWSTRTLLLQRGFAISSRINWHSYRAKLLMRYRNRRLHDPLPFRHAFVSHAPAEAPDIVQVHDLPALQAGVELSGRWQVPLIYDAHELYPEQRSFSRAQRAICSEAEKLLIGKADLVFAVNESIADEMATRYSIDKPVVLTNAIDPHPTFNPNERHDLLRQKLQLPTTRKLLLLQGGFSPHRNLNELVAAMRRVRTADINLVMMGFGEYGELLKATAAKLDLLNKNVHFLPAVPQSELLQHSASADLGIIPYPHVDLNSYYCTPNKLFEFIQAGLPILANDSPELRRFVVENDFGMVHGMPNPPAIANAIDIAFERLSTATWKDNLMSSRSNFSWKIQDSVYIARIDELLTTNQLSRGSSKAHHTKEV